MSKGPGDRDDDINRKLDALIEQIAELNNILRASVEGRPPPEEQEDVDEDLWHEGNSKGVSSIDEFVKWRRKAAKRMGIATPFFRKSSSFNARRKIRAHVVLFSQGYQNLEELRSTLGKAEFDVFLQEYAKVHKVIRDADGVTELEERPEGPIKRELVDLAEPGAGLWGVNDIPASAHGLDILPEFSPWNYVLAYGYHWHYPSTPGAMLGIDTDFSGEQEIEHEAEQPAVVGVGEDAGILVGQHDYSDVNKKLAERVKRRNNVTLPDRYESLL